MIRSMTAFARSEQTGDWGLLVWELRSVNHRYLEVVVRMPDALRSLETAVRERIGAALGRGKVECNLKLQTDAGAATAIELNRALVEQLLKVSEEIEQMMPVSTGLRPADLLRWPGVIVEAETDQDQLRQRTLDTLDQAIGQLVDTREREGQRIAELIAQRCQAMRERVAAVRTHRPEVIARIRDKMQTRLSELTVDYDSGRLEQEMAIVAQRLDVDEELDRLDTHLDEIDAVFKRREPVGRRLDFLMQELNREANTLSSKSADSDTTRHAVELKVLIEQMREQVQNIE